MTATLLAGAPTTDSSLSDWANFVRVDPNLYGSETERISKISSNLTDNNKDKKKTFIFFLEVLAAHPKFGPLAQEVVKPGGARTFRLFQLLQGKRTPEKMALLNSLLIVFVQHYVKQAYRQRGLSLCEMDPKDRANAQYEPNVMKKAVKHLFNVLKRNGVGMERKDFDSFEGSFDSVVTNKFEETKQHRPDYGTLKHRAIEELQDDEKILRRDTVCIHVQACQPKTKV